MQKSKKPGKPKAATKQTAFNTYQSVVKAFQANLHKLNIQRQLHASYLSTSLNFMGPSLFPYDVAHTWLVFYITNGLHLLSVQNHQLTPELTLKCVDFLEYCKQDGAFAGGDGQLAHLAPTYAAFLAIINLGPQAYDIIKKQEMYEFFKRRRDGNTFRMMRHGECDLRGIYIVIIIVKLLKMAEDVIEGVEKSIAECQTYEGGLTNVPGAEAHGGYTFCGVAALALINKLEILNIPRLLSWLSQRQIEHLGGFNGRTNKLVDSCYSYWVGATFNIINDYFEKKMEYENKLLYSQEGLQKYIICACQEEGGGLTDKPEKAKDLYHTSYALAGLALSQYKGLFLKGVEGNKLAEIDPIYNVGVEKLERARQHEWK